MVKTETESAESMLQAANAALETMCFTSVVEPCVLETDHQLSVATAIQFEGDCRGSMALALTRDSAYSIAANFLGMDAEELSEPEVNDVVCELTNMVAGSLVSRLPAEKPFQLSHPKLDVSEKMLTLFHSDKAQAFALEDGVLAIWFEIEA